MSRHHWHHTAGLYASMQRPAPVASRMRGRGACLLRVCVAPCAGMHPPFQGCSGGSLTTAGAGSAAPCNFRQCYGVMVGVS
jgi:hypothetical protein